MQNSARRPREVRDKALARIGRYLLESVIGSGSMGVVHRALDTTFDRTVAIKTVREELVAQERVYSKYRSRFYREATIAGALSHPNIVTLYDMGETEDGVPFLAMEYVPGSSLAGISPHGLSRDQIMWLLAQIASAIDYAHRRGVIHRDIKPSNILLGEGKEAKITDFGIAKLLGSEFTRSRIRFGTPRYMSPEQVLGKTLTGSADVFSLAVVAFELLSGETPFPGKRVSTVLNRLVNAEPIVPTGLEGAGLSSSKWREVFERALAKEPGQRYRTASELVSELVELFPGSWLGQVISSAKTTEGLEPKPGDASGSSQTTLTLWTLPSEPPATSSGD